MSTVFETIDRENLYEVNGGGLGGLIVGGVTTICYLVANEVVERKTGSTIGEHGANVVENVVEKVSDAWASYNKWHPLGMPKYK